MPSLAPSSLVTCSHPTRCLCVWRWLCLPAPTWSALSAACSSLSPCSCRLSFPATPSHGSAVSSAGGQDTLSRTTGTVSPHHALTPHPEILRTHTIDSSSSVLKRDMYHHLINVSFLQVSPLRSSLPRRTSQPSYKCEGLRLSIFLISVSIELNLIGIYPSIATTSRCHLSVNLSVR